MFSFFKNLSLRWTSKSFKEKLKSDPLLRDAYYVLENTSAKDPEDKEIRRKAIALIKSKGYFYFD